MVRPIVMLAWMLASVALSEGCTDSDQCLSEFTAGDCRHPYNLERMKQHCPKHCFNCQLWKAYSRCKDSNIEDVEYGMGTLGYRKLGCANGNARGFCQVTNDLANNYDRWLFLEYCPKTCEQCRSPNQKIIDAIHGDGLYQGR